MVSKASTSGSGKSKARRALAARHGTDLSFLGAPPLIPGEKAADYGRLLAAVTGELKSAGIMETMWTRDIVDSQWEITRYRRIMADFITHRYERSRARATMGSTQTENSNGDLANIVAININEIERIDRMITTLEARRNAAYREIERHRVGLGERLRRAVAQVEDAEFREVDETTSIVPHDSSDKDLAEPAQHAR